MKYLLVKLKERIMNIFKKTIFSVLFSLLVMGNVQADKIKIGTEGLILRGIQKMPQVS